MTNIINKVNIQLDVISKKTLYHIIFIYLLFYNFKNDSISTMVTYMHF